MCYVMFKLLPFCLVNGNAVFCCTICLYNGKYFWH